MYNYRNAASSLKQLVLRMQLLGCTAFAQCSQPPTRVANSKVVEAHDRHTKGPVGHTCGVKPSRLQQMFRAAAVSKDAPG